MTMIKRKSRKALITGIIGQDGSYLAEFLLAKGYQVHGVIRRVALEDPERSFWRIRHIQDKIILHAASLDSYTSVFSIMDKVRPDEIYHLAAQSFVSYSFDDDFSTINENINGTHFMLSAAKNKVPKSRFYFAGSSEMFGHAQVVPQNEETGFRPRSPYGISKVAGFYLTRNFREVYGLFACNGILFNHESPRRGFEFVTRKITSGVAKIKLGLAKELRLGNLEAKRDWGFSGDYIEAMWLMLQQATPDDYVIATGEVHSVKQFAQAAFNYVGLDWKKYVHQDRGLFRPAEAKVLCGDYRKAKKLLGWKPKVKFDRLVKMMVDEDLRILGSLKND